MKLLLAALRATLAVAVLCAALPAAAKGHHDEAHKTVDDCNTGFNGLFQRGERKACINCVTRPADHCAGDPKASASSYHFTSKPGHRCKLDCQYEKDKAAGSKE